MAESAMFQFESTKWGFRGPYTFDAKHSWPGAMDRSTTKDYERHVHDILKGASISVSWYIVTSGLILFMSWWFFKDNQHSLYLMVYTTFCGTFCLARETFLSSVEKRFPSMPTTVSTNLTGSVASVLFRDPPGKPQRGKWVGIFFIALAALLYLAK